MSRAQILRCGAPRWQAGLRWRYTNRSRACGKTWSADPCPSGGTSIPRLQETFPAQLGNVDLETFYQGINKVEPSLIRVEADEATYNLHIMLRLGAGNRTDGRQTGGQRPARSLECTDARLSGPDAASMMRWACCRMYTGPAA